MRKTVQMADMVALADDPDTEVLIHVEVFLILST